MPTDLRTRAIVLRRTNYGESDRILNLLTPEGKIAVLARGVRKEKSRLAGGIELFSVTDVVIHQGKSSLGTLTSAKMLEFYQGLLTDLPRLELAASCLKKLDRVAEQVPSPEHFDILRQALLGLNRGLSNDLVLTWFEFNLARANGEELNLIYDINNQKLSEELTYYWDNIESALRKDSHGDISSREIKLARLLLRNPILVVSKVADLEKSLPPLFRIAQTLN